MSDSVPEIIGGSDGETAATNDPITTNDLENNDFVLDSNDLAPDLAVLIYGPLAITQTAAIVLLWFLIAQDFTSLYWWTWFSAMLAVCISWGPVALIWPGTYFGIEIFDYMFYLVSLASIDGPMFFYAFPLVLALIAYIRNDDTGLYVKNIAHFWLGWSFAVLFTGASIVWQLAVIPSIGVWYSLRTNMLTVDELEEGEEEEIMEIDLTEEDVEFY